MNRFVRLGLLMGVLLLVAAGTVRASEAADAEPAGPSEPADISEPRIVTLGIYVFDIRDVNLRNQSFFADFYIWMRYDEPNEARAKEIEKIEFMNGKADAFEELDRKKVGSQTYVCWRVSGTFHFNADLRHYPFDTQRLEIAIEHPSLEVNEVVYLDDEASYARSGVPKGFWGVKEGLDIPEFSLRSTERRPSISLYKTDFGDPTREQSSSSYSRFVLSMRFARDFMPYFFKIIIPLLVIVAMAYLVFFLPPKEVQTASGLGITALLSCIAFNVSVGQTLPEVGYLVVSDKFFICTYILLFLTLLQTVLTFVWDDAGKTEFAARWDGVCRIVFPILYFSAFGYLLVEALVTA